MPQTAPPEISVIIVNYGTAALTLHAVESVLAQPAGGRVTDVHVVDNASPGDDAGVLGAAIVRNGWQDRVTLHAEAQNHGFGRGNNLVLRELAARAAPPEYVFLLNPDARLANDAIGILADFLAAHPQAAIAGARIAKPDGQPVTAAFRFPGIASVFADAISFGPVSRRFAHRAVPLPPDLPTCRVDWVSGAALLARLKPVMQVGGFDPVYFLYYEEVDLMLRLARAGWQTWHVPAAAVIHAEGAATGVKSGEAERRRRPAYWYASWRHFFERNHGRAAALAAGFAWLSGAALNRVIAALRGRPPAAPPGFFRDFWAFAARPLLGLRGQDG